MKKHQTTLIPHLVAGALMLSAFSLSAATNKWETSAAAGATITRGNSETALGVITVNSSRKWEPHEVLLGAQGTYGESTDLETDDTDKTAASVSAFGQYNKSISERWYWGVRSDFLHDDIADVSYRFTLSPLVGYYAIKNPNTTLKFEAGPAGVVERVGGVKDEYVALRFGERFEHKFSPRARVWQAFEIVPQVDRLHNYIINAEVGAEASLTEKLSLRAVVQDTYDNRPADSDEGGDGRKKNDIKFITSLVYKF